MLKSQNLVHPPGLLVFRQQVLGAAEPLLIPLAGSHTD
jgi:hypothetical protein